jgi:hypothetical protein
MLRRTPPAAFVLGIVTVLVGLGYLTFLVLWRREELWDFLSVALGNDDANRRVALLQSRTPGFVYMILVSTVLEFSGTMLLLVSAMALMSLTPWARWSCFYGSLFLFLFACAALYLVVFPLARAGQEVKLLPLLVYGAVIIYTIFLAGSMFLPSITASYAGTVGSRLPKDAEDEE